MSPADIVIVIVIGLSAVIGLMRGLLREVLSLIAWVGAFILALYFSPQVARSLEAMLSNDSVRLVAAFAGIFITVLILASLVQWLLGKLVSATGLTGTDRMLGFVFGGARGVILSIVILIALRPFAETTEWWRSSMLIPQLAAFESEVLQLFGRASSRIETFTRDIQ